MLKIQVLNSFWLYRCPQGIILLVRNSGLGAVIGAPWGTTLHYWPTLKTFRIQQPKGEACAWDTTLWREIWVVCMNFAQAGQTADREILLCASELPWIKSPTPNWPCQIEFGFGPLDIQSTLGSSYLIQALPAISEAPKHMLPVAGISWKRGLEWISRRPTSNFWYELLDESWGFSRFFYHFHPFSAFPVN